MNHFLKLLRHDLLLLNRYQIISISVAITLIYIGLFLWLRQFGIAEEVLIVLLFNDPAILGLMFIGVMMMFEKSESTITALSVLPISAADYLWSKAISLTGVALFCALAIALVGLGTAFSWIHFSLSLIGVTLLFSFIGVWVVAGERDLNRYLMKVAGVVIVLSLPVLTFFGLIDDLWVAWLPTYPAIKLIAWSITERPSVALITAAYGGLLVWCGVFYRMGLQALKPELSRA